ncbi:MAG: putative sulfate exporter family transporter, partial [Porticoccaceae bacterium]|nr:putative sulfate exporter family transporter [Porticoccaceae bacterium]
MDSALSRHKNKFRGIIACILVALASKFLALNYGAPAMLFALILGMSVNFLSESEYSIPGIDFCSSTVLRFGVILLGSKIL